MNRMTDLDHHDLEDNIPVNRINTTSNSFADQNNFIEISEEDDSDDNIEYVEYSDGDYVYIEEDDECNEEETPQEEELVNPVIEPVDGEDKESEIPTDENSEECYHCSSCNVNFESVTEHIDRFHKNQSVLLDGIDTEEQAEPNDDVLIKTEPTNTEEIAETESMEMTEVEYVEEDIDGGYLVQLEEPDEKSFNDAHGRPYKRKKVKVDESSLMKNSNSIHKCDSCQGVFMTEENLLNHECFVQESPEHVGSDDTIAEATSLYNCTECNLQFDSDYLLGFHLRMHHKSKLKSRPKKTPCVPVVCFVCNTTFPSNKSFRLHSRMHDPIKLKPIEEAIGYEMKSCSKDGKLSTDTFYCVICHKRYDSSFQEAHMKSHKLGQKHNCSICNKKFSSEINLTMHLSVHQDQTKVKAPTKAELSGITLPYECGYCGRQFARPHEKVKHERIHTGSKPFKCEICGKCFRVTYCLTLHLRTHTAARPYVCPHCNKRYKAYAAYNHHLMTHSDERPYKCPHCPKAFKTSVQLAGHKNSHTKPFSCPECNRPFASLYAVRAHMETHKRGSQNLKHRCMICGAIYARIFALKDHMKEQHQTTFVDGNEVTDLNVSEVPFIHENEISSESMLPDHGEEIMIGEIEHFQTEEVVTDWMK